MAAVWIPLKKLKESVSCPVCLDIYQEPQQLQCLHSLCKRCSDTLIKNEQVTCPQCRVVTPFNMRKLDFKTQALVELYREEEKAQVNSPADEPRAENPDLCDLCEITKAELFCNKCKHILCTSCNRAHFKFSLCRQNNGESLTAASERQGRVIDEELCVISETTSGLETKFKSSKSDLSNKKSAVMENLEKTKEGILAAVNVHFSSEMRNLDQTTSKYLEERRLTYTELLEKLQRSEESLKKLKASHPGKIVKNANEIIAEAKSNTKSVEASVFPSVNVDIKQVNINCPTGGSLKMLISFNLMDLNDDAKKQPNLKDFLNRKLHLEKKFDLPNYCNKLLLLQNKVLCFCGNVIAVHSAQTGEHIETKYDNTNDSQGATGDPRGQDIVADLDHGLKCLNIDGSDGVVHVPWGPYHAGTYHNGEHFVARKQNQAIYIDTFVKEENNFIRRKSVSTAVPGYDIGSPQTLAVTNNHIFICSYSGNVYQLAHDGHMIRTWGKLSHPWLCESDSSSGCLLIAEETNHRLLVLQPESKDQNWTVVDIDAQIMHPRSAVVTQDGTLFIAGMSPGHSTLYVCRPICYLPAIHPPYDFVGDN